MKTLVCIVLVVVFLVGAALAGEPLKDESLILKRVETNLRLKYPADSVKVFLGLPPLGKTIAVPDSLLSQNVLKEIAGDRLWISDDLNRAAIVTIKQDTVAGSSLFFVTVRILYDYTESKK